MLTSLLTLPRTWGSGNKEGIFDVVCMTVLKNFFSLRLTEMNRRVNSQLWSEKHLSLCTVTCWVKVIFFQNKWQKNVVYVYSLQTFNPGLELNSLLDLTSCKM